MNAEEIQKFREQVVNRPNVPEDIRQKILDRLETYERAMNGDPEALIELAIEHLEQK